MAVITDKLKDDVSKWIDELHDPEISIPCWTADSAEMKISNDLTCTIRFFNENISYIMPYIDVSINYKDTNEYCIYCINMVRIKTDGDELHKFFSNIGEYARTALNSYMLYKQNMAAMLDLCDLNGSYMNIRA